MDLGSGCGGRKCPTAAAETASAASDDRNPGGPIAARFFRRLARRLRLAAAGSSAGSEAGFCISASAADQRFFGGFEEGGGGEGRGGAGERGPGRSKSSRPSSPSAGASEKFGRSRTSGKGFGRSRTSGRRRGSSGSAAGSSFAESRGGRAILLGAAPSSPAAALGPVGGVPSEETDADGTDGNLLRSSAAPSNAPYAARSRPSAAHRSSFARLASRAASFASRAAFSRASRSRAARASSDSAGASSRRPAFFFQNESDASSPSFPREPSRRRFAASPAEAPAGDPPPSRSRPASSPTPRRPPDADSPRSRGYAPASRSITSSVAARSRASASDSAAALAVAFAANDAATDRPSASAAARRADSSQSPLARSAETYVSKDPRGNADREPAARLFGAPASPSDPSEPTSSRSRIGSKAPNAAVSARVSAAVFPAVFSVSAVAAEDSAGPVLGAAASEILSKVFFSPSFLDAFSSMSPYLPSRIIAATSASAARSASVSRSGFKAASRAASGCAGNDARGSSACVSPGRRRRAVEGEDPSAEEGSPPSKSSRTTPRFAPTNIPPSAASLSPASATYPSSHGRYAAAAPPARSVFSSRGFLLEIASRVSRSAVPASFAASANSRLASASAAVDRRVFSPPAEVSLSRPDSSRRLRRSRRGRARISSTARSRAAARRASSSRASARRAASASAIATADAHRGAQRKHTSATDVREVDLSDLGTLNARVLLRGTASPHSAHATAAASRFVSSFSQHSAHRTNRRTTPPRGRAPRPRLAAVAPPRRSLTRTCGRRVGARPTRCGHRGVEASSTATRTDSGSLVKTTHSSRHRRSVPARRDAWSSRPGSPRTRSATSAAFTRAATNPADARSGSGTSESEGSAGDDDDSGAPRRASWSARPPRTPAARDEPAAPGAKGTRGAPDARDGREAPALASGRIARSRRRAPRRTRAAKSPRDAGAMMVR